MSRTEKRPKELGWTLWFALGGFLATVLTAAARMNALSGVFLLVTIVWTVQGVYRALRIHRWVRARQARHPQLDELDPTLRDEVSS